MPDKATEILEYEGKEPEVNPTPSQFEDIIRRDLEWAALQMLKEGNDKYEFIGNKAALFASFCRVIEYYSTKTEYADFVAKTKGKKVE